MSRYNQHSGSGIGSSTSGDFDDITLKLQKYSAIRVTGKRVGAFESEYGDKVIAGFDDVEILDGIVFQREDKPETWKVFSPGKFFNVDPDTGKVYEQATPGEKTFHVPSLSSRWKTMPSRISTSSKPAMNLSPYCESKALTRSPVTRIALYF